MLKQNGGGICDHEVGTGKTLIMCIAAHELKRLNLAHKPMIIGLKANVAGVAPARRTICVVALSDTAAVRLGGVPGVLR